MNLFIDIFICIAISVLLLAVFIFLGRFLMRKGQQTGNMIIGAVTMMLIASCILNGIFICWLLILYDKLPAI